MDTVGQRQYFRGVALRQQGGVPQAEARATLRSVLQEHLAKAALTKVQLAARTGMSRTTLQEAFSADGPVPSARTLTLLAKGLRLDADALLRLRAEALSDHLDVGAEGDVVGRPINDWDPHDLEVHPAAATATAPAVRLMGGIEGVSCTLPGYVRRPHDDALAQAVGIAAAGRSAMVVLVGSSSTGKTRACWEAVQPLAAAGWRLWHPFDPTRAQAALADLQRVGPRTVVWLNEAQHYLAADHGIGEQVAAAVHTLLTAPERGPVLVLGTLWPAYKDTLTSLPPPRTPDLHSRARELLAGRLVNVPEVFDSQALATARDLAGAGDRQLADVLPFVEDGQLTQYLAGAPELLHRYRAASAPARALLHAAMDARRLGVGLHLPVAFLTDAAEDYLNAREYDQLSDDWIEQALAELARPVHGNQSPLRRIRTRPVRHPLRTPSHAAPEPPSPAYRLADYLEQHGRTERRSFCPPTSFWYAAHDHLEDPHALYKLATAANYRHRLQWADRLNRRAAHAGSTGALISVAVTREKAGEPEQAEHLARLAADLGNTEALRQLAVLREKAGQPEEAERLARLAADMGNTDALLWVADMREEAGRQDEAERLAHLAAAKGETHVLVRLSWGREEAGEQDEAERLAGLAAAAGDTSGLLGIAHMREEAGQPNQAEPLARMALDAGDTDAMAVLAVIHEALGEPRGAERFAHQAAVAGNTQALVDLAWMRREAGRPEEAERLVRVAHKAGDLNATAILARMREEAGQAREAERLACLASDAGESIGLRWLALTREGAGQSEEAERLATLAARSSDFESTDALRRLAQRREAAGELAEAERLAHVAADSGDNKARVMLVRLQEKAGRAGEAEHLALTTLDVGIGSSDPATELARLREEAGLPEEAERLALRAADAGHSDVIRSLTHTRRAAGLSTVGELWPHGLEPDGTPSPPW